MRHAVISGGTGYVGRFIVEGLLGAGFKITVLGRSRPAEGFFSAPVEFYAINLDTGTCPPEAFATASCFVHAAFDHAPGKYRGGEGDDPDAFRQRNLAGSISLFEAAKRSGVQRSIFLSSRAAYGTPSPGVMLDELDTAVPDTLYGEVKLAVENALQHLCDDNFLGTSLRITGVYGPAGTGRKHKWASLFADYLVGKNITPRAGTEVHGADVAQAVRLALEYPEPAPKLLNVSDLNLDNHTLLAIVQRLTGCPHALPQKTDVGTMNVMQTARLRGLGWIPGAMPQLEATIAELLLADGRALS